MTDAHCHVPSGDPEIRELLIGRDFFGTHPWEWESFDESVLRTQLSANPRAGVGEIGLDRLRAKIIPDGMRRAFVRQLEIAAEYHRPVVLHGAKCWGEVVKAVSPFRDSIPWFLFHGFSRSDGLIPDIVRLNGYISVGPAVLNDHAVNYRELVKRIPADRLLLETDRTEENAATCPSIREIAAKTAELRGVAVDALVCPEIMI